MQDASTRSTRSTITSDLKNTYDIIFLTVVMVDRAYGRPSENEIGQR